MFQINDDGSVLVCATHDQETSANWDRCKSSYAKVQWRETFRLAYAKKNFMTCTQHGIGGFASAWYCCSTEYEYNTNYAWDADFTDYVGSGNYGDKSNRNKRVRAVRAFNIYQFNHLPRSG